MTAKIEIAEGTQVTFRKPWLDNHTARMAAYKWPTTLTPEMVGTVERVNTSTRYPRAQRGRGPLKSQTRTTYFIRWTRSNGETFTNYLPASAVKVAK